MFLNSKCVIIFFFFMLVSVKGVFKYVVLQPFWFFGPCLVLSDCVANLWIICVVDSWICALFLLYVCQ